MQNLRFSIAAGETKVFVLAGRYLEVIEATGPVTLGLYDVHGSQTDDAKDVLSGTYMEGAFSQFEIYSATAQTIELFLTNTRGGTRRQPGNVRVIDEITDAIVYASAAASYAVTAWVTSQIVSPAANTKGMIVRLAGITGAAGAGGTINTRIVACKSAPTGYVTPAQQFPFASVYNTTTTAQAAPEFRGNKLLPPGWGLYVASQITTAAATANDYGVAYELVQ